MLLVSSYCSPKTECRASSIAGYGRFTKEAIKKDEIVAIRSGHIVNGQKLLENAKIINGSEHQIADDFYLVPLVEAEFTRVMCFLNHSCQANIGLRGDVTIVAMRDIEPGEELCLDYAMIFNNEMKFECQCGVKTCRKIVTGKDWMEKELQEKYRKYFSSYLLQKISS